MIHSSFVFLDGTIQKKDNDAKCFDVEDINYFDRFVQKDNACLRKNDPRQFSFSNIGKYTVYKYRWLSHLAKYAKDGWSKLLLESYLVVWIDRIYF